MLELPVAGGCGVLEHPAFYDLHHRFGRQAPGQLLQDSIDQRIPSAILVWYRVAIRDFVESRLIQGTYIYHDFGPTSTDQSDSDARQGAYCMRSSFVPLDPYLDMELGVDFAGSILL